jgi:hypothetical protein
MKKTVLWPVLAAVAVVTSGCIETREDGTGSVLNGSLPMTGVLAPDAGPGGLPSALTFTLGLSVVPGDLILLEPASDQFSDVIRFNPGGTIVFYSDLTNGPEFLADTGFPTELYANSVRVTEVGDEGSNGFIYTPTANQPGYLPGDQTAFGPLSYTIVSDVPEPSALALLGIGLAGLGLKRRRIKLG